MASFEHESQLAMASSNEPQTIFFLELVILANA